MCLARHADLVRLGLVVGLGHEFEQSQQDAQGQSHSQQHEEAPQLVGLQGLGLFAFHTTLGPPFVPQIGKHSRLTQLQDGDAQVLHQRGTLE